MNKFIPPQHQLQMIEKVNLAEKFNSIADYWNPRIAGELNGQHVKLVKFSGAFEWHSHEKEDELFLVISGKMRMKLRSGDIDVLPGEFIVIPRGTEHCPEADEEVSVLLFEPAGTLNTGDKISSRTVFDPGQI